MVLELIVASLIWVFFWILVLSLRYRQVIVASWKEPVLKKPILIFESDDWGPGRAEDARQLNLIANLLGRYSDGLGRNPVMTLGVILAVPNSLKIKASGYKSYYCETLGEAKYSLILKEIKHGIERGVFSVQLHGMEHYWPKNLMKAINDSDEVKSLLDIDLPLRTELLPDSLQSRWFMGGGDCSLSQVEIIKAVEEEVATFRALFNQLARVVVPPTFVWNEKVELSWRSFGLEYLVTPGFIATGRDAQGVMGVGGKLIYNSMKSIAGLTYIVRNDYFEPALGHTVEQAMLAMDENTRLGRPTLLEIHRFNFCDHERQSKLSLVELEQCIQCAIVGFPALRFISTSELGDMYLDTDCEGSVIDRRILNRLLVFMARLWACDVMRKWLYISGIFIFVKTLSVVNTWR